MGETDCASAPTFVVGGDEDENGCLASAGFSWCEATQKCQRFWEEPCASSSESLVGADSDENGCISSAGYSWCNSTSKCQRSWEAPCESDSEALPIAIGGDRDIYGCISS